MTTMLTHRYGAHGVLRRLFACRADEVLVAGPAGTGKSRACLEKLHRMALLTPGMRGLIVRKTLASLGSTALVTWRTHVAKEALAVRDVVFYGGSPQESPQYRYTNGSVIVVGGMDRASRIMSSEYDVCLIGDTEVFATTPVGRGFKRPYSGQLVTITTAAGNKLTGTPNHPILTPHGWVGLGALRKGDYVVSRVPGEPLSAHPNPDVAQQPAPIAEVVRSLAEADGGGGVTKRVETVPMNFHGDGTYGYVDVVTPLGLLKDGALSCLLDPITDLECSWAELEQAPLVSFGPGVESGVSGRAASVLRGRPLAELAHAFSVGLGFSPRFDGARPRLSELGLPFDINTHPGLPVSECVGGRLPLDPTGGHLPLEAGHTDVNGQRYLKQPPLSGQVAPDRVVDVRVTDASWSGHVYNLQTEASWYYASNIIVHNCYVQEATELTEDDWEAITTRLRHGKISFQQLLADCNPDAPHHWLKARCDRGQTTMLESRHEDNPTLFGPDGQATEYGAAYIAKLDNLTGVRYQRLRRGLWVAAEGIIYEEYDPAVHLVDRFKIPDSWTRHWAVDFGYTNPFVLQCWAEDPDGRLYRYREIYYTRRTVDVHARTILAQVRDRDGWREPKPRSIVCDHDAEGRAVLERELGMSTRAAHKSVTEGIQAVQRRLARAGDGRPRLFLMRDSLVERDPELVDAKRPTCTEEEIVGYVWDTGTGKAPKETPLKVDDHGADAARYLVANQDLKGRANIRFM